MNCIDSVLKKQHNAQMGGISSTIWISIHIMIYIKFYKWNLLFENACSVNVAIQKPRRDFFKTNVICSEVTRKLICKESLGSV